MRPNSFICDRQAAIQNGTVAIPTGYRCNADRGFGYL
ncbi:hypothetical protein shim_32980 [Shimia sp. SK013]|nr:hypothetical protein shim_32980 [Shimia sp. SK013]